MPAWTPAASSRKRVGPSNASRVDQEDSSFPVPRPGTPCTSVPERAAMKRRNASSLRDAWRQSTTVSVAGRARSDAS